MIFREATVNDIEQMHVVRMSVKENVLNNPALVTYDDYVTKLTRTGKGWVCEEDGKVVGLSIVDAEEKNVWGLFVAPEAEGKGIGRKLHDMMLEWFFAHHEGPIWLSTSPGTRAESFYRKAGWADEGLLRSGEIKFVKEAASS
jgi:GNAT superfamily N-acetyltransferase